MHEIAESTSANPLNQLFSKKVSSELTSRCIYIAPHNDSPLLIFLRSLCILHTQIMLNLRRDAQLT